MVHHLVAAILVNENRVLLGLRSSERKLWPGVWDVFGGHIEPGEQPEQTLMRELQEELGVTPTQWMFLESIEDIIPAQAVAPAQEFVAHFFCVTAWDGTPVNRQLEEHSSIQWFSYEEANRLELAHPSYPRLFAQCLEMSPPEKPKRQIE